MISIFSFQKQYPSTLTALYVDLVLHMNDFSISVPWCLLVAIFWGVTNPFMKRGADGIETVAEEGRVSQVLHELKYLLLNWKYYVPFLLNQFGSVLYFWTLSTSNLSVVVPLTNSLTFLIASVTGRFLGEEIGGAYFYLGVSLMLAGIFVSTTSVE